MPDLPTLRRITEALTGFAEPHVIRRDGSCQECGRWPDEVGGPCPLGAVLVDASTAMPLLIEVAEAALQVTHADSMLASTGEDVWRENRRDALDGLDVALDKLRGEVADA